MLDVAKHLLKNTASKSIKYVLIRLFFGFKYWKYDFKQSNDVSR